jgi:hypothetical protein
MTDEAKPQTTMLLVMNGHVVARSESPVIFEPGSQPGKQLAIGKLQVDATLMLEVTDAALAAVSGTRVPVGAEEQISRHDLAECVSAEVATRVSGLGDKEASGRPWAPRSAVDASVIAVNALWITAGRLLNQDTEVRRALGASPGETTLQAAKRVVAEYADVRDELEGSDPEIEDEDE